MRLCVAAVAMAFGSARTALADDGRLAYDAPPECPDRDALVRATEERAPGASLNGHVSITRDEAGRFIAEIVIDGARPRTISARGCDSVVQASALVLALAHVATAASRRAPAKLPEPPETSPIRAVPESTRAAGALVSVVASGGAMSGLGVAPAWFGEVAIERRAGITLRGTLGFASGATVRDVVVRLVFASLEVCPFGLHLARDRALVDVCARAEGGALLAEDVLLPAGFGVAAWVAPGLAVRLAWRPFERVYVGTAIHGLAPLLPARFFEGVATSSVYSTPAIAVRGEIGAGASFP